MSTIKSNIRILSPSANNISIDNISNILSSLQKNETPHRPDTGLKIHKYTQSQTRLDVPVFKLQLTSPKVHYTEIKTDRVH